MSDDERFMRRALELAERGRYSTSPNPMVGCVIVQDGAIVGEGFHERAGLPHAEVLALANCSGSVRGATAYVTLEPCSHFGRTPPCANALVEAGLARVVVAAADTNPLVNGGGIAALRTARIEVTTGVLETEARRLNEKFFHAITKQRPFVLIKAGMTLDGKLATVGGESQWITSPEAREKSLSLREEYDAVLVGSGTVIADNPRLTRRLELNNSIVPWHRVVVDADGFIPADASLLSDELPTLLYTSKPNAYRDAKNTDVVGMEEDDGRLDLDAVFADLYKRGIQSVLVEGGSALHSDLIKRHLWQKMTIFVAPMIVGGWNAPSIFGDDGVSRLTDAYRFRFDAFDRVGTDVMVTAYPE